MTGRTARLRHDLGFRRFWTVSTVSAFGTYISDLAIAAIVVQVLGGTVADVGPARRRGCRSARAAVVVGVPLGGLFADAVGMQAALVLAASGIAAAGVLLGVSGFRRAGHDDESPSEPAAAATP